MDTDQLLVHARARFEHSAARKLLKEKYEAKLLFTYNGGMWRAGPELLTLLQAIPVDNEVILLDMYETPVKINPAELQYLVIERWQEQMNAWLIEYNELNKNR